MSTEYAKVCDAGFYVAGLQPWEHVLSVFRVICTLVTVSIVSSWFIRRGIGRLMLLFLHWLGWELKETAVNMNFLFCPLLRLLLLLLCGCWSLAAILRLCRYEVCPCCSTARLLLQWNVAAMGDGQGMRYLASLRMKSQRGNRAWKFDRFSAPRVESQNHREYHCIPYLVLVLLKVSQVWPQAFSLVFEVQVLFYLTGTYRCALYSRVCCWYTAYTRTHSGLLHTRQITVRSPLHEARRRARVEPSSFDCSKIAILNRADRWPKWPTCTRRYYSQYSSHGKRKIISSYIFRTRVRVDENEIRIRGGMVYFCFIYWSSHGCGLVTYTTSTRSDPSVSTAVQRERDTWYTSTGKYTNWFKLKDRESLPDDACRLHHNQYATHVKNLLFCSDSPPIFSPISAEMLESKWLFRERVLNVKFVINPVLGCQRHAVRPVFLTRLLGHIYLYQMASITHNPQDMHLSIHILASRHWIYSSMNYAFQDSRNPGSCCALSTAPFF